MERPKVGVCVAIRREGKVLLGLRNGAHEAGTWGFPGGHLEHGEEFIDCALRETDEECGVKISRPWLARVSNDIFDNGKHYITLWMVADWISGEAEVREPHKMTGWQWFDWASLPAPLMKGYDESIHAGFNPLTALPLPPGAY